MVDIYVVIPCYEVSKQIISVIESVLKQSAICNIIVVDDACPEATGKLVREHFNNHPQITVLTHEKNQGVGGAMCTGYQYAFKNGADIVVKMDGDGQMNPEHISSLINPIVKGKCDYTKGNRFYYPRHLKNMPKVRVFGNSALSLISKFASGYWTIMDPTNGYTALHSSAYSQLELNELSKGYFFESDMLYQLGNAQAVVRDIAIPAIYADEESNLSITRVLIRFPGLYFKRFIKRIILRYFIREFNFASLEILFGGVLLISGLVFGIYKWIGSYLVGISTPAGTVMIVGILIILGFQLLLSALNYDVNHEPSIPLSSQNIE
jgi:dolichol-phosphate mannosyltransferase